MNRFILLAALLIAPLVSQAQAGGIVAGGTPLSVSLTSSADLRGLLSDETGTGAAVFANTPTLVTPILGTPTSGTLSNCTGLPAAGVVGTAAILGANTFTNLQTITQGTANTGILASTGYSLTGSNATNLIDLAGTWNTSGTPTAIKLNITDSASNAASLLMDLQVGAASKFAVSKAGNVLLSGLGIPGSIAAITVYGGFGINPDGSANRTIDIGRYSANIGLASGVQLRWESTATITAANDIGLSRNAAGVLEINSGTAGTFRDLKVRDIIIDSGTMVKSSTAFTNGAAAQTGTLTNAPAAGNPTKWIPINDNGTTRYIPAW